jgi:hypothetical protein
MDAGSVPRAKRHKDDTNVGWNPDQPATGPGLAAGSDDDESGPGAGDGDRNPRRIASPGSSDHDRFCRDMDAAGIKIRKYLGPFWWKGPAVIVRDPGDISRLTDVKCRWENHVFQWIVHPRARDPEDDGL